MNDLTTRRSFLPTILDDSPSPVTFLKHPLTALAEQLPEEAASIMRQQIRSRERLQERALRVQEREAVLRTSRSISHDVSSEVCDWLRSRPWETEFESEFFCRTSRGGFFSGQTETTHVIKRVRTGGTNYAVLAALTGRNY